MVLGKLTMPGRPDLLHLQKVRVGVAWTFFLSSIISVFFLSPSGRRSDID